MTDEEKRIKIAELCGYREITISKKAIDHGGLIGSHVMVKEGGKMFPIPDYLNDLNAMHEAEKMLWKDARLYTQYAARLSHAVEHFTHRFQTIHATAAQRAEAFILTMEGAA